MKNQVWGSGATQYFYELDFDEILKSLDLLKIKTTGRVMQLGSMENRVYDVELDLDYTPENPSENFVVVKFYRPGRWTKEQILDEHEFLFDLKEEEIPVIAPLKFDNQSLFENATGIYFALFPKMGGRAIDEWNTELVTRMGRLLGRLHNVGARKNATHRISLNPETYGFNNLKILEESSFLPNHLKANFLKMGQELVESMIPLFEGIKMQRVHGDCHHGNTLLRHDQIHMIDFDDMVIAPRVQDIWMVIPGRDQESIELRNSLLDGYEEMSEFDYREIKLIEPLRALRMIHYSAWIAKRYDDASFKRAFPHFKEEFYWQTLYQDLLDQKELIANKPLFI